MSFREKARNFRSVSRKTFPQSSENTANTAGCRFADVIAETLRETLGGTRASVKTVMAYTGANERTVKNWFEGKNGPSGENLVALLRSCDEVLEALLLMAGREDILAGKLLVDARHRLVEMLKIIDELQTSETSADPPIG